MGARFSAPVQTGSGAHPASYTMGTGCFPALKRPGRGVGHPPHLAEVKEIVELNLYCELYFYLYLKVYDLLFVHIRVANQPMMTGVWPFDITKSQTRALHSTARLPMALVSGLGYCVMRHVVTNCTASQWRTQEFCSGGGVQQIQLKTEDRENGDLGAVAPWSGVLEAVVI